MKNDSKSDIADRQLPTVDTPHNESEWTEIGTAEITQSIFGKARVHIIRQHDKVRRAWFLTALVVSLMVTAVAAVIWQEQNAPLASTTAPAPQLSALPEANAPASPVVAIPATVLPLMEEGKPGAPTAIDNPAASRVPQKILSVNTAEHTTAKPTGPRHVIASKPTTAILTTNNNAAKSQTDMQQFPKLSAPLVPPTTPSATQPEGGNQLADPINAQHN
jgi:multisubunit Na+/H+ antiporter MnhC subunit